MSKRILQLLTLMSSSGGLPVIAVSGNSVNIANGDATPSTGDNTDFGLTTNLTTVSKTFNIQNTGSAPLTVSVAVPTGYTLSSAPTSPIAAGGNSNFTIRFDALTPAAYSGTVTITNNSSVPSFTFSITASALYSSRVLLQSPQRYYKMDEGSGSTATDSSTNAQNGSYTGVTWVSSAPPQGGDAPYFDGTNDLTNIYNANLGTNFSFDEVTIIVWSKVQGSGVWTDATQRYLFLIQRSAQNLITLRKNTASNQLQAVRTAANATIAITANSQSDTGWVSYILSFSLAGNALLNAGEMKLYKNGAQIGSTATGGIAATSSGLSTTQTVLGASSTTPTAVWNGYEAHVQIYNTALTSALLALGTV